MDDAHTVPKRRTSGYHHIKAVGRACILPQPGEKGKPRLTDIRVPSPLPRWRGLPKLRLGRGAPGTEKDDGGRMRERATSREAERSRESLRVIERPRNSETSRRRMSERSPEHQAEGEPENP